MKEYEKDFDVGKKKSKKLKAAFEQVADIRKFEIELYWKRATYFWALIAVTFAGYFAILGSNDDNMPNKFFLSMIVAGLGMIFTFAWHRANRGSKYWQENWENHMDLLEDAVTGPLYKTLLERPDLESFSEKYILGPKSVSVSKINQWVSVYVLMSWIILLAFSTYKSTQPHNLCEQNYIMLAHLVIWFLAFSGMWIIKGKSDTHKNEHTPNRRVRSVRINKSI
ncbi:TPA: hypothetical protein NVH30_003725 [Vibrio cholerae]|nr:hypothetical protein [Vibrio cholerae]HCJ7281297.1 hypothetical protein [Vibrio cholerae]HCJ7319061.1 hypothetical protein [Vibrio cholerae]